MIAGASTGVGDNALPNVGDWQKALTENNPAANEGRKSLRKPEWSKLGSSSV